MTCNVLSWYSHCQHDMASFRQLHLAAKMEEHLLSVRLQLISAGGFYTTVESSNRLV